MLRFQSTINSKAIFFFSEKEDVVNELKYDTIKPWFVSLL